MVMKSLANQRDKQEIAERAQKIQPSSQRRWCKMTAHPMLCHLCDSFRGPLGSRDLSTGKMFGPQRLVKWIALNSPFPRPHGVQTRPAARELIRRHTPVDISNA